MNPGTIIHQLTRHLGKPSQVERAEKMLGDIVEDREIEASPKRYRIMMGVLWGVAIAVMVFLGVYYKKQVLPVAATFDHIDMGVGEPERQDGFTEKEELLLKLAPGSPSENAKRLYEMEPDNAGYYMNYAVAYASETQELPEGYFETIRSIDPDNAMPLYFAAGIVAKDAIETIHHKREREEPRYIDGIRMKPRSVAQTYKVLDEAQYAEALGYLDEAYSKHNYHAYSSRYIQEGLNICEPKWNGTGLVGAIRKLSFLYSNQSEDLYLRRAALLLGAAAQRAAESNNQDEFEKWVGVRDDLLGRWSQGDQSLLISALVRVAVAHSTALVFLETSKELEMDEYTQRFQAEVDALDQARDEQRIRSRTDTFELTGKMGFMHSFALPVVGSRVKEAPQINDDDLKPMRMAENELAAQIFIGWGLMIIVGFSFFVFILRFCVPPSCGTPAARMMWMLRLVDWAWAISLGVIAPLVIYFIAVRFTPLGGHNYGFFALGMAYPSLPLISLLLSMIFVTSMVINWRLRKRVMTHAHKPVVSPTLLAGVLAAVTAPILVYPWIVQYVDFHHVNLGQFVIALCVLGSVLLLILIWGLVRLIKSKINARFHIIGTLTGVMSCMPIAIIGLALTLPIHRASEVHWAEQDRTIIPRANEQDFGLYEGKVARQLYKETNAMLQLPQD